MSLDPRLLAYPPEYVLGVLAHEVGHVVNKHAQHASPRRERLARAVCLFCIGLLVAATAIPLTKASAPTWAANLLLAGGVAGFAAGYVLELRWFNARRRPQEIEADITSVFLCGTSVPAEVTLDAGFTYRWPAAVHRLYEGAWLDRPTRATPNDWQRFAAPAKCCGWLRGQGTGLQQPKVRRAAPRAA